MRKALLLAVIVFLLAAKVTAATYYVSTTGSDSDPGTEPYPWLTLQKCADTINAGDTCIVEDGSYNELVTWSRSGSAGNLMTMQARHDRLAVNHGYVVVTGDYVALNGIKNLMNAGRGKGISLEGDYDQCVGCYVGMEDGATLGLNNVGFTINGTGSVATGTYVTDACFGVIIGGSNNTFADGEVYHPSLSGSCGDVDYIRFFGSNHIIANNHLHGVEMGAVGGAHVDCFQTFDNSGASISNILIERNYCDTSAEGIMASAAVLDNSTGLVIRNNVFRNNGAWCVCVEGIKDTHILYNTCDTTSGLNGMWCRWDSAECEFKGNILYGPGSAYGVYTSDGATYIDPGPNGRGSYNLIFKAGTTYTTYPDDIQNQDPNFNDRENGVYTLQVDSPAKDAGISISGWTSPTDLVGTSRPSGDGWDIGAYEWIAGAAPPSYRWRNGGIVGNGMMQ